MSLFGELAVAWGMGLLQDNVINEQACRYLVCILALFDILIVITWQTVDCQSVRVDSHSHDWLF